MSSIIGLVNDAIHGAATPFANTLRLGKLPENAPTIVTSALFFWGVHMIGAPIVSRILFPTVYANLKSRRDRNNWNNRVAAFLHAVLVIPLALRALNCPAQNADRVFGWDEKTGFAVAIACGYFLWDSFESTIHWNELGFVVHALICFSIFFLTLKPFIAYYAPRFLLWELSTPFLNIHWFLDKSGKTGSTFQLINGVILLSTFAGARLIYGSKMSFEFWKTMYEIRNDDRIPFIVPLTYCLGNVLLNGLNWYWFYKMVAALRRRMRDPKANAKVSKPQSISNGHAKSQ